MNIAVILAAGKSERFGLDKALIDIDGKPEVLYSVDTFEQAGIKNIIIVANKNNVSIIKKIFKGNVVLGGGTRQQSVFCALQFLKNKMKDSDMIFIHNVSNPFVTKKEIQDCMKLTKIHGACIVAHKSVDTIKKINGKFIEKTAPREKLIQAQTPQCFRWNILYKAYLKAKSQKKDFTDDAQLLENINEKVAWIEASPKNKKMTFPHDLNVSVIGMGSDCHEFSDKKGLTLGGVKFLKLNKLDADSDGDAILHALATAISSAIGGGSLGIFATAMCNKGIKNSTEYLKKTLTEASKKRLKPANISISIETHEIKIDPLASSIKKSLSKLLNINEQKIGITAIRGKSKKILYCNAAVLLRNI